MRISNMPADRYVPDNEIASLARRFIQIHGSAAIDLVAKKEQEVVARGDLWGATICRRLVSAIEKLLTLEPVSLLVH